MSAASAWWLNGRQLADRVQSIHLERFTSLTLDPLLLRPWEIARLTDWQIDALYFAPAIERKRVLDEEMAKAKASGGGPPPAGGSIAGSGPSLGEMTKPLFIEEMTRRMGGGSPEEWGKAWEQIQAKKKGG